MYVLYILWSYVGMWSSRFFGFVACNPMCRSNCILLHNNIQTKNTIKRLGLCLDLAAVRYNKLACYAITLIAKVTLPKYYYLLWVQYVITVVLHPRQTTNVAIVELL